MARNLCKFPVWRKKSINCDKFSFFYLLIRFFFEESHQREFLSDFTQKIKHPKKGEFKNFVKLKLVSN